MDCRLDTDRSAKLAACICRTGVLLLVWFFILLSSARAVLAEEVTTDAGYAAGVLEQSRQYKYRFREGDETILDPWVALLQQATQVQPDNADLWYALGYATLAQAGKAIQEGNTSAAMGAMQKGPAALRQALKINPDHALALSQLGGIQTLLGPVLKLPAMAPRGVAQMNRAIKLAPNSIPVRLMRAFAGLNLPPELRNPANDAQDLDFLIEVSEWGTAGDYIRIMRGDLHFEMGEPEMARAQYQSAEGSGSGASAEAKSRLTKLDQGGVPMEDIRHLRSEAGAQCAMCHRR